MRSGIVIVALALGLAMPAGAPAAGRYVAVADSVSNGDPGYVERFAAHEGITDVHRVLAIYPTGEVLTEALPRMQQLIADPTDTTVVSVQVGGWDYRAGVCPDGLLAPTCAYADNMHALLGAISTALAGDPGAERLLVFGYFNPQVGRNPDLERTLDVGLRGTDGRIDPAAHGSDWGMTDMVGWLACRHGGTLVDAWAAFKQGGASLTTDGVHPTAEGSAVLAALFADPASGGPTPPCPPTTPFATTLADEFDNHAHGIVEPRLSATRWWFEYGLTTAYGRSTAAQQLPPSAGTRAASAPLPARDEPVAYHVRLVTENAVGRFAGEDQVVTVTRTPVLEATLVRKPRRDRFLERGLALRVRSTATTIRIRGRLERRGEDPLVLRARERWTPGAERRVRVVPTDRGRRLVRRARRPRLVLTVTGSRPTGDPARERIALRLR